MATYEDVLKAYQAAGFNESNFSAADQQLLLANPDAGMEIIQAKIDWQNATTPEARALANQRAETARATGGYSGGTNGMGYTSTPEAKAAKNAAAEAVRTQTGYTYPSQPIAGTDTSQPSYIDFMTAYNNAGLNSDTFSANDLRIAQQNPSAGMQIIQAKQDWQNATTPEEKAAAHASAETGRAPYGYSGGDDGMGYTKITQPTTQTTTGTSTKSTTGNFIKDLTTNNPAPYYGDTGATAQPTTGGTTANNNALLALLLGAGLASGGTLGGGVSTGYDLFPYYKYQYNREGSRAAQDTIGKAAAATGGIPSSYAVTAAQQMQNYYNQQLIDQIPALYQQGLINLPGANGLNINDWTGVYDQYNSEFGNQSGSNVYLNLLNALLGQNGTGTATGETAPQTGETAAGGDVYTDLINALTGQTATGTATEQTGTETTTQANPYLDLLNQLVGGQTAEEPKQYISSSILTKNADGTMTLGGSGTAKTEAELNVDKARNSYKTASDNIANGKVTPENVDAVKSDPTINAIIGGQSGYVEPFMWNALVDKYTPEQLVAAGIKIYYGDTSSSKSPIKESHGSSNTEPTYYPDGNYPKGKGVSTDALVQQSERQFYDELLKSGVIMSNRDLQLAMDNPEAGRLLLSYIVDEQKATNDATRNRAVQHQEEVRQKYGGYSGLPATTVTEAEPAAAAQATESATSAKKNNGASALPAPTTQSSTSATAKSTGSATTGSTGTTPAANTATAQNAIQLETLRAMQDPEVQQYLANSGKVALPIFEKLAARYSTEALINAGLRV